MALDGIQSSSAEVWREEIEAVKQRYCLSCVNTESKNGMVVLCIQPFNGLNVSLKLHLHEKYPLSLPDMVINADCLSKVKAGELQRLLELKSSEMVGKPVIVDLLEQMESYLEECGLLNDRNQCCDGATSKLSGHSGHKKMHSSDCSKTPDRKGNLCDNGRQATAKNQGAKQKGKKSKRKKKQEYDPYEDSDPLEDIVPDLDDKMRTHSISDDSPSKATNSSLTKTVLCDPDDPQSKRPTHFIAIRITNPDILQGLKKVQSDLVEKEPLLEKGVFAAETFHITLCTLGLDTPEDVEQCISVLKKLQPELRTFQPVIPLTVYSMSQFYNRAIFAKVSHGEDLIKLRQILRKRLQEYQVEIRDEREGFTPHLTVIKVKRPERKMFGNRNIKPSLYAHVVDVTFGDQYIDALYLCCMDGQRREDGFYNTLYEMHL